MISIILRNELWNGLTAKLCVSELESFNFNKEFFTVKIVEVVEMEKKIIKGKLMFFFEILEILEIVEVVEMEKKIIMKPNC